MPLRDLLGRMAEELCDVCQRGTRHQQFGREGVSKSMSVSVWNLRQFEQSRKSTLPIANHTLALARARPEWKLLAGTRGQRICDNLWKRDKDSRWRTKPFSLSPAAFCNRRILSMSFVFGASFSLLSQRSRTRVDRASAESGYSLTIVSSVSFAFLKSSGSSPLGKMFTNRFCTSDGCAIACGSPVSSKGSTMPGMIVLSRAGVCAIDGRNEIRTRISRTHTRNFEGINVIRRPLRAADSITKVNVGTFQCSKRVSMSA